MISKECTRTKRRHCEEALAGATKQSSSMKPLLLGKINCSGLPRSARNDDFRNHSLSIMCVSTQHIFATS